MTVAFFMSLALLAVVLIVVNNSTKRLTVQAGQRRVEQEAAVIRSRFEHAEQDMMTATKLLASRPGLIEAVASQDANTIKTMALIGAAPLDLDEIDVIGLEGADIVTVQESGGILQSTQRASLTSLALLGVETTGAIVDQEETALWLAAAVPLRDATGTIAGALLTARHVDDAYLQERNFYRDDIDFVIVAGGRILGQAFSSPDLLQQASARLLDETAIDQAQSGQFVIADALWRSSDGTPYALAYTPLIVHDDTVATIGIMVDMSQLRIFGRQLAVNLIVMFILLMLAAMSGLGIFVRLGIALPINRLRSVTEQMIGGDYGKRAKVATMGEIGQLSAAFNSLADQLVALIHDLEQRTADLQQRTTQLQASAEVSHATASIRNVDQMVQQVVELVCRQFGLYYVGLFLLDDSGEWAVLQAGSGEAGRAMVARGYRLKVGQGLIGRSIARAEPYLASDVDKDPIRLSVAELPDTRSEAALPLRSRGQVIGALTVQSDRVAALDRSTVAIWQVMADQLAVALDNAQLLATAQAALEAERLAYGEISRQAWLERSRVYTDWGYDYQHDSLVRARGGWTLEMEQAAQTGQEVITLASDVDGNDGGGAVLAIPLKVRDSVVGVLSYRKDSGQAWTVDEMELLRTLTGQLEVAMESARLYEDTQRRAAQERVVGEVTARMRETLDVDLVLRTAVQEIREALGLHDIAVRFHGE